MKIYFIPEKVKGLIFDIDLTLYDNKDYYNSQTEVLIQRLAEEQRKDYLDVKNQIDSFKLKYAERNKGHKPSLGNTFVNFGIPIQKSVAWREELHKPENFLKEAPRLRKNLLTLKNYFKLIAVTNNPSSIGMRTLNALGLRDIFLNVIGLDISMVSKPHEKPFYLAKKELHLKFRNLISIGDRFEIDLEIPLALGMGGILIEKAKDIYKLPDILIINCNNN